MQEKILKQIEDIIVSAKLEPVCNFNYANTGKIYIQRPNMNQILGIIGFSFDTSHADLTLNIKGKFMPPQQNRDDYFNWYIEYSTDLKGHELITRFLYTLKAEVYKL